MLQNLQCLNFLNQQSSSCFPSSSDINECEAEPCRNGGICTDLVANYSCECPGEFMGRNCQYSKYLHTHITVFLSPPVTEESWPKSTPVAPRVCD